MKVRSVAGACLLMSWLTPATACTAASRDVSQADQQSKGAHVGRICIAGEADPALAVHIDGPGLASTLELPLELHLGERAGVALGESKDRVSVHQNMCDVALGDTLVEVRFSTNLSRSAVLTHLEVRSAQRAEQRDFVSGTPTRGAKLKHIATVPCIDDPCGVPPGRPAVDAAVDRTIDEIISIIDQ